MSNTAENTQTFLGRVTWSAQPTVKHDGAQAYGQLLVPTHNEPIKLFAAVGVRDQDAETYRIAGNCAIQFFIDAWVTNEGDQAGVADADLMVALNDIRRAGKSLLRDANAWEEKELQNRFEEAVLRHANPLTGGRPWQWLKVRELGEELASSCDTIILLVNAIRRESGWPELPPAEA